MEQINNICVICFEGLISDVEIVKQSRLLEKLDEVDLIL